MAAGLEKNGRSRVQAIFSHAAGDNSTLLSFSEGDVITLLVPEARDGWHYGENEKNKMYADIYSDFFVFSVLHCCMNCHFQCSKSSGRSALFSGVDGSRSPTRACCLKVTATSSE